MDAQLIDYITQNLHLGYDMNSIKDSLAQSGYSKEQINAAMDYISAQRHYGVRKKPRFHVETAGKKPVALIATILIVLLLVSVGAVMFIGEDDPTPRPPTRTDPMNLNPPPPITEPNGGGGDSGPVVTPPPNVNPQPSTNTGALRALTRLEIDEEVERIAATQPLEAMELCGKIVTRAGTFTCIQKVAVESKESQFCKSITDIPGRDQCYLQFPINEVGTNDVCAQIQNTFKKDSCFNLYENLDNLRNAPAAPTAAQLAALDDPDAIDNSRTVDVFA